jgi:hypothetical protein
MGPVGLEAFGQPVVLVYQSHPLDPFRHADKRSQPM